MLSGAGDEVFRFVGALGDLARARLAEVDQILREIGTAGGDAERVTRDELLARLRARDVVVLDPNLEVVAYCRGPLCLLAPEAVATLRSAGRSARCLEDGMPEWRHARLPVAAGADPTGWSSR
ncbi:MAG: rhodanese-like domain-containing protein [Mycobacteriales bacterium]